MAARELQFDFYHRQSPPVRCHQRELVILETEKNAVEHVAGLIGGNGVRSFAQTMTQIFLANRDHFRILKFRQWRKFFLRQSENFKEALAAAD